MAEKNFFLLLLIAKHGGVDGEFVSSTSKIAHAMGLSQQSVSRKLRELAIRQFIALQASPAGVSAKLLEKGKKALLEKHTDLQEIFSKAKIKKISGTVQSGHGEGKYYMSFKQYTGQLKKSMGFEPFAGTLNLSVDEAELASFKKNMKEIYINGFATKERSFGGLLAMKVKINGKISGAVVFPDRTNLPPNVAEVIAPASLRKKFDLKDGDKISLEA